jgi:hypothetical protein
MRDLLPIRQQNVTSSGLEDDMTSKPHPEMRERNETLGASTSRPATRIRRESQCHRVGQYIAGVSGVVTYDTPPSERDPCCCPLTITNERARRRRVCLSLIEGATLPEPDGTCHHAARPAPACCLGVGEPLPALQTTIFCLTEQ